MSAEEWPLLDYKNGAWLGGRVRALERLATDLVKPDTRVVPADGRMMTGNDIVRHRDMYQKLFTTMIGYLNKGSVPRTRCSETRSRNTRRNSATRRRSTYGALRSMMIAYVPD